MSRVKYKDFEEGKLREPEVWEIDLGKILLVEDVKIGGYTSFFKHDIGLTSQGDSMEEAVFNLLNLYKMVIELENIYLNKKKILPK